jgi:hypothetical protein
MRSNRLATVREEGAVDFLVLKDPEGDKTVKLAAPWTKEELGAVLRELSGKDDDDFEVDDDDFEVDEVEFEVCEYEFEEVIGFDPMEVFDPIDDLKSLEELNNFLEDYLYERYADKEEFAAYLEVSGSSDFFGKWRDFKKEYHTFYHGMNLTEVAEDMVNEGIFGNVSSSLMNYIDFESLGNDLRSDGYYETEWGVMRLD